MVSRKTLAPAKVNLTLHVTGRQADGTLLRDSMVVFTDAGDQVTVQSANEMSLTITGPFAEGLPPDDSHSVMRAAQTLRRLRGVIQGAHITIEKHLPQATGLGDGATDVAAVLKLLADLWQITPLDPAGPEAIALGADIPVCLFGPAPARVSGKGGDLETIARLPDCAIVLVHPKVALPEQTVLAGLSQTDHPPMEALPDPLTFDALAVWLRQQRNDLQPSAIAQSPEIQTAIDRLTRFPMVVHAAMSGSGATCYGLVRNMADARHVARVIQVAEMSWWVTPANLLR